MTDSAEVSLETSYPFGSFQRPKHSAIEPQASTFTVSMRSISACFSSALGGGVTVPQHARNKTETAKRRDRAHSEKRFLKLLRLRQRMLSFLSTRIPFACRKAAKNDTPRVLFCKTPQQDGMKKTVFGSRYHSTTKSYSLCFYMRGKNQNFAGLEVRYFFTMSATLKVTA